jgi:hypothetical protein
VGMSRYSDLQKRDAIRITLAQYKHAVGRDLDWYRSNDGRQSVYAKKRTELLQEMDDAMRQVIERWESELAIYPEARTP